MNIKIVVATHKQYKMPSDKELYLPVQSGAAIYPDLGIQRDDEGDNISAKNPSYNELCPTYWAWKNLKADYIGVCHYRRIFSNDEKNHTDKSNILTKSTARQLCEKYDVILPLPRKYIRSYKSHYINSVTKNKKVLEKDIAALKQAVHEVAPSYESACDIVLQSKKIHLLNCFIMKYDLFCDFCEFKFGVLERAEELLIDRANKDRYLGALGEFLTDVWVIGSGIEYHEIGLVELEKPPFFTKVLRYIKKRISA